MTRRQFRYLVVAAKKQPAPIYAVGAALMMADALLIPEPVKSAAACAAAKVAGKPLAE